VSSVFTFCAGETMRAAQFTGELLAGHKEAAIEVPFDPATRWGVPAHRLWTGRRGHAVKGRLNGVEFESVVVPRSRRFYLLVPDELQSAIGASIGDMIRATIAPMTWFSPATPTDSN
jgi:uncharacterized protein DUF1905